MVDTISNAKSIRHPGSKTARPGTPPATSDPAVSAKPVAPVSPAPDAGQHDHHDSGERQRGGTPPQEQDETGLRLEVSGDESGGEVVYRFVDAQTGAVVREWDAGEFGKLREYMRARKIHLLDKKV